MRFLYAVTNKLNLATLHSVSTEDTLYVKENLYNQRPSFPFRFTAKAAQWIKADFATATKITLAAVFNHNLLAGATVNLEGNATDSWATPSYQSAMTWRLHDQAKLLDQTYRWFRLTVDDGSNPAMPEIGELFLGEYGSFADSYLQAGRAISPKFFRAKNVTTHGQVWSRSYGESEEFEIVFQIINPVAQVDAIRAFLTQVHENDGRFVVIPEETQPHVYYVFLDTDADFASSIIRGETNELTEWRFRVVTLVRGITLL